MRDPWYASAVDLAREIRERRLRASELLEIFLERVDRLNPAINAIVVQDRDAARRRAVQADAAVARGEPLGPLHGVPMTLKESNDWAGTPSTWGFPEHRENRPAEDAVAVTRQIIANVFDKEDRPMIEAQQTRMRGVDFWSEKPVLFPEDGAAVRARKILERLIREEQQRKTDSTVT